MRKHLWLAIFVIVYIVILLVKFWGLISVNEILPGGDTTSHFVALQEFINGLREGRLFNYLNAWFGGEPIFHFYPPFSFLVMAVVFLLFSGTVSLFLIFRWFVFITFAIFPISFYFFLKEFLGERVAKVGIWLSLLWVFYPKIPGSIGAGASGAVFYGLFSQVLAVSFFLLYLVFLKKIIDSNRFDFRLVLGGAVTLALIILTHTLTTFAALVATIIFIVYFWRRFFKKSVLISAGSVAGLALLLSAFWLVPFLVQFGYSSGERVDFKGYFSSALLPFFQFDISQILNGQWLDFYYIWFITAILFIGGLVLLIKEKKFFLPVALGVMFFAFNVDYINQFILPSFPIHYYRMASYEVVFYLSIAAVGLEYLFRQAALKKLSAQLGIAAVGFALAHYLIFYNLPGERTFNISPQLYSFHFDFPYHWSIKDFGFAGYGQQAVDFLREGPLPEPPRRVLSDINIFTMVGSLGSIHYFNNFLPLINDQDVIVGLYAESSWQIPFIFPSTNFLSGNLVKWGRVRDLHFNDYFNTQDIETMLERIRLFGVNYMIMTSESFETRFPNGLDGVQFIKGFGPIRIYYIEETRPFIYEAKFQPGLFIGENPSDFREFALGWYSEPELLDIPIVWSQKRSEELTAADVESFNFLIVKSGIKGPSSNEIDSLRRLGKPILLTHLGPNLNLSEPSEEIWEISDFRPVAGYYDADALLDQPNVNALQILKNFVIRYAVENDNIQPPEIIKWTDNEIVFSGHGPIIVNLGYFPYWNQPNGGKVYPVTPGQMLVFADGETELIYQAGLDATIGRIISLITLAALAGLIFLRIAKKDVRRRYKDVRRP